MSRWLPAVLLADLLECRRPCCTRLLIKIQHTVGHHSRLKLALHRRASQGPWADVETHTHTHIPLQTVEMRAGAPGGSVCSEGDTSGPRTTPAVLVRQLRASGVSGVGGGGKSSTNESTMKFWSAMPPTETPGTPSAPEMHSTDTILVEPARMYHHIYMPHT